jgi:hypothetical protein
MLEQSKPYLQMVIIEYAKSPSAKCIESHTVIKNYNSWRISAEKRKTLGVNDETKELKIIFRKTLF